MCGDEPSAEEEAELVASISPTCVGMNRSPLGNLLRRWILAPHVWG